MNPLYIALVSPALAGLLGILVWTVQRWMESRAILSASAACVESLCHLIRELGLERHYKNAAADGDTMFRLLDFSHSYLTPLEALLPQIGRLRPSHAHLIARFHSAVKVAEDTVRIRTEPDRTNWQLAGRKMNPFVADQIEDILRDGDRISRLLGRRALTHS